MNIFQLIAMLIHDVLLFIGAMKEPHRPAVAATRIQHEGSIANDARQGADNEPPRLQR